MATPRMGRGQRILKNKGWKRLSTCHRDQGAISSIPRKGGPICSWPQRSSAHVNTASGGVDVILLNAGEGGGAADGVPVAVEDVLTLTVVVHAVALAHLVLGGRGRQGEERGGSVVLGGQVGAQSKFSGQARLIELVSRIQRLGGAAGILDREAIGQHVQLVGEVGTVQPGVARAAKIIFELGSAGAGEDLRADVLRAQQEEECRADVVRAWVS